MSVNVILSGHGMNSEPYLANLAATEEGIAYIYNAKRDLDEAEGEFYLTSELMDQPLDMTSLDENGELSDFITALRVWDRVAKENVAKKIDFQSLGNFPKGSINQILAYSEVDEEGNPTGFKAMAALGGVNANLLHNWYFANPVNQRGQTEYTEAGYTIDRWKKTTSDGAVTMTAGGITATNEAGAGTLYLSQYLRGFDLRNFDCVFSVLTENGLFLTKQVEATGSQDETPFGYLRIGWSESANCSFVQIQITQGNTANILAAKLELGEGQTLAHQDADGNWVLNEIPDYAEELIRCQSAPVDIDGAGGVLPLTGGTVTGTLVLSKTTDLSATADNGPALIVGDRSGTHLEIDGNEITAKSTATTGTLMQFGECKLHDSEGDGLDNLANPRLRNITAGTGSLTAGTSSLTTGRIRVQYE